MGCKTESRTQQDRHSYGDPVKEKYFLPRQTTPQDLPKLQCKQQLAAKGYKDFYDQETGKINFPKGWEVIHLPGFYAILFQSLKSTG